MEPWLLFAAGGVFFAGIAAYGLIMIFWPEWVGITGKKALDAEAAHRSDKVESDQDMLKKMQD